jgi:hypothetical protein
MGWKAKMMKALVFLTAAKEGTTAAAWHTAAFMVEREGYLRESKGYCRSRRIMVVLP